MSDRRSWNALLSHPASGAGCEISGEGGTSQGGLSACAWCKDPSPWWHWARIAIRSNSIRIPQEDTWCAPLSRLPQGEAHDTRYYHTLDDSISYSDLLSESLTKVHKPCYVIPTARHSPRSTALRWCVRTPCLDIFCREDWTRTQSGLKVCVHLATTWITRT